MKSVIKIFAIFISIQLVSINIAYAAEVNLRSEYLVDIRRDDGDIYLNRLSVHKKLDSPEMTISAFGEGQWNLETDEWEKVMFGLEVEKNLWQYLYIGQSIQTISGEMLDYMAFDADSYSIDTTTKIRIRIPLFKDFSLHAFEEYSLNLEKGRDEYCETGAEVVYSPVDLCSISIGWRHTDRIHNLDTDYLNISTTLKF